VATVAGAVVLAVFVVPRAWGLALIAVAIAWEILEKVFWFYRTKGFPLAVGPEAMIGQPVDVIAACRPDGKVRLSNERWNANCPQGADIGETVIVDRVDRLTLIVSSPTNSAQ
jgi:membrane protein implicated in regulation of membrane protease activity